MPILNWKDYGINILGLGEPFTEADVHDQIKLIARMKREKEERDRYNPPPKTVEFKTGTEFIAWCEKYNARKQR